MLKKIISKYSKGIILDVISILEIITRAVSFMLTNILCIFLSSKVPTEFIPESTQTMKILFLGEVNINTARFLILNLAIVVLAGMFYSILIFILKLKVEKCKNNINKCIYETNKDIEDESSIGNIIATIVGYIMIIIIAIHYLKNILQNGTI